MHRLVMFKVVSVDKELSSLTQVSLLSTSDKIIDYAD